MRVVLVLTLAAQLFLATGSKAAEVQYQHPNLTIVAREEPLDSVLKSLARQMRIFVTIPSGLNPMVSCNAREQSIKQALKCLMGDMSYSLEWEQGGERLVGLTIFAGAAAERDAQTMAEREEHEVPMVRKREVHEAEMELRRQEEEIAHEERMKEDAARHETETRAYVESQGFVLP